MLCSCGYIIWDLCGLFRIPCFLTSICGLCDSASQHGFAIYSTVPPSTLNLLLKCLYACCNTIVVVSLSEASCLLVVFLASCLLVVCWLCGVTESSAIFTRLLTWTTSGRYVVPFGAIHKYALFKMLSRSRSCPGVQWVL